MTITGMRGGGFCHARMIMALYVYVCVYVCDTTVLIICSSETAAASVGALQVLLPLVAMAQSQLATPCIH